MDTTSGTKGGCTAELPAYAEQVVLFTGHTLTDYEQRMTRYYESIGIPALMCARGVAIHRRNSRSVTGEAYAP